MRPVIATRYAPRWLFTISYATRAHGIIVNYCCGCRDISCNCLHIRIRRFVLLKSFLFLHCFFPVRKSIFRKSFIFVPFLVCISSLSRTASSSSSPLFMLRRLVDSLNVNKCSPLRMSGYTCLFSLCFWRKDMQKKKKNEPENKRSSNFSTLLRRKKSQKVKQKLRK